MSDQSFHLLTVFCRALAHKLRTPLSVLANELSYLESVLPNGEELVKSREKLKVVLDVIKFGGFTKDLRASEDSVQVSSLIRAAISKLGNSSIAVRVIGDEQVVTLNSSHLSFVICAIAGIVSAPESAGFEIQPGEILFTGRGKESAGLGSYKLFSDFAANFDADYLTGPLVDSLVLKNNWRFSARFEGDEFFILLGI